MKTKLIATLVILLAGIANLHAQGTTFIYQGRLNDGANPANGIYDLRLAIHDALSIGTQQGNLLTNAATAISNGLFTVTLDFGSNFPGADRWLEIGVRSSNQQPNGSTPFPQIGSHNQIRPIAFQVANLSRQFRGHGH